MSEQGEYSKSYEREIEALELQSSSDLEDLAEEFQDACDFSSASEMDLTRAMEEAQVAIDHFFNNKFEEARAIMKPWASTSIYHSAGESVFSFLSATLTFDRDVLTEATGKLKHCMILCNALRKKKTIGESINTLMRRHHYNQYTDLEVHAELCFAEVLLLRAILTFMEDEELMSFVKGSYKIRQCFNSYKECNNILRDRKWTDEKARLHFESGVRMGIGSFNLMISLLPQRIIRLLEFVGFSGDKEVGLEELMLGSQCEGGLRNVLCILTLLIYHLVICSVLSDQLGNLTLCEDILIKQLEMYPQGVWFLFFKGRLEFMKGELEEAKSAYIQSWKSQDVWPQFHHLCFWELLWIECMDMNWRGALKYCDFLLEESKWSLTIYAYQKAAVMCMIWDELSAAEKDTCVDLMRQAPEYKQRIAGKSLPMEKFVVKRCKKFTDQGNRLLLPALEMMYLWNIFRIFHNNFSVGHRILKMMDDYDKEVQPGTEDQALMFLLRGAIFRHLGAQYQAMSCLQSCVGLKKQIKEDLHLVPYAIVEIGLLFESMGERSKAIGALEDVRKNYSGYPLESRLHFRIHTTLTSFKSG